MYLFCIKSKSREPFQTMPPHEQPTRVLRENRKRPRRLSDTTEPVPYAKVTNISASDSNSKLVETIDLVEDSTTIQIKDADTTSNALLGHTTLASSHSIRPIDEISVAVKVPPSSEESISNVAAIPTEQNLVEAPQVAHTMTKSITISTTTSTSSTAGAITGNAATAPAVSNNATTAPAPTIISTRSDPHGISAIAAATAASAAAVAPPPSGTEVFVTTAQATSAIYSRSINPFSTQFALATLSWAPLHLASLKGDVSLVRALCSSGVNVNARTVTDGKTALAIAVEQGWVAVADELMQRGGSL